MAEVIAIVVCGLIILAFVLACCIMLRNAGKRKRMATEKQIADEAAEQARINKSQKKQMAAIS